MRTARADVLSFADFGLESSLFESPASCCQYIFYVFSQTAPERQMIGEKRFNVVYNIYLWRIISAFYLFEG